MNKNERLSDIIGQCNDEFIMKANAEATPIAKRRISFVPFAATAACACLVGGGIFAYSKSVNDKNPQSGVSSELLYSAESVLEWSSIASNDNETTEETFAQQESMREDELIAQEEMAALYESMQSMTETEVWNALSGFWNGADNSFCQFKPQEGENSAYFAAAFWESEWGDRNGNINALTFTDTDELTFALYLDYSAPEQDSVGAIYNVVVNYSKLGENGVIHVTYGDEDLGEFRYAGATQDEAFAKYVEDTSSTDIAVETPWEDLELCYQYPEVAFNGVTYDAQGAGKHFDVGSMLGAQTISGTNYNTDKTYDMSVEFYAIQGIDSGYAIAVKFAADEPYYIYTNCLYDTPTFGDFVEGLNLEENMTFDAAYIEGPATFVMVQDIDSEFMWDFLADCYDAESVGDYLEFSEEIFRENSDALDILVDFSISSDVLGFENLSFAVTQGGYISTNAISTGRAFYIGADKAKELLSCIKIDDNTVVQVPTLDDDNTSAEDTDIYFTLEYAPIDDSQSATLIAEFKEQMGEAPLNLTTTQANSILQKISGLTLKDADVSEIEFPTGGGIVFEIVGGHRYNFIGENILLFDDAYYSIESDATEIISELTSLLSGASSESNTENVSGTSSLS